MKRTSAVLELLILWLTRNVVEDAESGQERSVLIRVIHFVYETSMAAPHVSAIAGLVLQSKPLLSQAQMENILSIAASRLPFPADDAIVAYPFEAPFYYTASWGGGDFGAGLLQADEALKAAASKYK